MKDISEELHQIITAMAAEGKTPTTATVKARLSQPAPVPAIVKAIQIWKSTKRVPKVEIAEPKTLTADERISVLEKHIEALTTRVALLEAQLKG
jgi:hypothetical protein